VAEKLLQRTWSAFGFISGFFPSFPPGFLLEIPILVPSSHLPLLRSSGWRLWRRLQFNAVERVGSCADVPSEAPAVIPDHRPPSQAGLHPAMSVFDKASVGFSPTPVEEGPPCHIGICCISSLSVVISFWLPGRSPHPIGPRWAPECSSIRAGTVVVVRDELFVSCSRRSPYQIGLSRTPSSL